MKHLRLAVVMTRDDDPLGASVKLFEGNARKALQQAQDAAKRAGAVYPTAHVQILVLGSAQTRMGDIIDRARRVRQSNASYLARASMHIVKTTIEEGRQRASTLLGLGAALSGRAHPSI